MKRTSLLFSLLLFSTMADAAWYYRFWQGKKRTHWPAQAQSKLAPWAITPSAYYQDQNLVLKPEFRGFSTQAGDLMIAPHFEFLVNDTLIPATVSCCAQESLVAYMPVLSARYWDDVPDSLLETGLYHDELALIVYRSQEAYQNWRSLNGQKIEEASADKQEAFLYGPLHADVFEMPANAQEKQDISASRSQVPQLYPGKISWPEKADTYSKEVAYDLLGSDHDWQDPKTQVGYRYWNRSSVISEVSYLERIESYLSYLKKARGRWGLLSHVFLVTDQYFVEFFLVKNAGMEDFLNEAPFFSTRALSVYLVQSNVARDLKSDGGSPLSYPHLQQGEVGRLIFTPGKRPAKRPNWLLKN